MRRIIGLITLLLTAAVATAQAPPPTQTPPPEIPEYNILFLADLDIDLPDDIRDAILNEFNAVYLSDWEEVRSYRRFFSPHAVIVHESALDWIEDTDWFAELHALGTPISVININAPTLAYLVKNDDLSDRYGTHEDCYAIAVRQGINEHFRTGESPPNLGFGEGSTVGCFVLADDRIAFEVMMLLRIERATQYKLEYVYGTTSYYND